MSDAWFHVGLAWLVVVGALVDLVVVDALAEEVLGLAQLVEVALGEVGSLEADRGA